MSVKTNVTVPAGRPEPPLKRSRCDLMNILLGIVGAAVAGWLFSFLGIHFAGWIGYLIAGFIGACILIAIARAFQRA